MGRTITFIFYHPSGLRINNNNNINLPNWRDNNRPYYYGNVPSFLNQFYKKIEINLKTECTSEFPKIQGLPHVIIDENYKEEFIKFLTNSIQYDKKFKDLKELENLFMPRKYCMFYIHYPLKKEAEWFMEARFYDLYDLEEKRELLEKIDKYVVKLGYKLKDFL